METARFEYSVGTGGVVEVQAGLLPEAIGIMNGIPQEAL
jgi:hypothetical protein